MRRLLVVIIMVVLIGSCFVYGQTTQRAIGRGIETFPYPFSQIFYIQPRFDRTNYDDGTYFNSYVLRGFSTYWHKMHFRIDIPFAGTNTSGENVFGLSDIIIRAVRTARLHDKLFFGYGLNLVMNTATDPSLGNGRWDLRPAFGFIYFRGTPDNITGTATLSFEYRMTLAKQAGRSGTNVLAMSPNVDWWFKKWYVGYYSTWIYDIDNNKFDIPLDVEVGYNLKPNLVLAAEFIQPLFGNPSYRNEFAIKLRYSFIPNRQR